jgi:hypothetical protein
MVCYVFSDYVMLLLSSSGQTRNCCMPRCAKSARCVSLELLAYALCCAGPSHDDCLLCCVLVHTNCGCRMPATAMNNNVGDFPSGI